MEIFKIRVKSGMFYDPRGFTSYTMNSGEKIKISSKGKIYESKKNVRISMSFNLMTDADVEIVTYSCKEIK